MKSASAEVPRVEPASSDSPGNSEITGAEIVVRCLQAEGVEHV